MIFIHNPYVSKDIAMLASDINSLGWCSFSSFFLLFMLAFSGKKKILKKKWFYLLLFGLPMLFIYKQWTGFLITDLSIQYYGWRPMWGRTAWPYLFYVYYISFVSLGLYINIDFMRKAPNTILKKQATIIFVTIIIVLFLGTVTDVILPISNIHIIPNIADSIMLIWAFGVVYAIARYKFLAITPATAADKIISNMHDCMILLDLNGNIVTINKATFDILGYKENELKGTPVSRLFPPEEINSSLVEKITRDVSFKDAELTFQTKEGKEVPVLFSNSILEDDAGTPRGIVCVAKDISERKKLEDEIFKTKKLESIGILAGGIAHDFNNLLSVILGNVSLAQLEVPSTNKNYKYLQELEKAALKAGELTGKFLTFSQGRWLKKEPLTLSHLLKDVMMTEPELQNTTVSFTIDQVGELLPIHGDERQLKQVMKNLFVNAYEATTGETRAQIDVSAENTTMNHNNQFQLKPGKYVKILIKDHGTGIHSDIIDHVFDPYFSTKERDARKGMGMGLTLCYSIIKKHDGHIRMQSQPGKGTTVTLFLPAFSS